MINQVISKKVNPDLLKERKNCTFDIKELTYLLDGGEENTKQRKSTEKLFLEDSELQPKIPFEYLSHKEKYEESLRISCLLTKKFQQFNWGLDHFSQSLWGNITAAILKDGNPLALNFVMFVPTLIGQGDEEQTEWLHKSWNGEILGTYAQTELGHGTFIRGLETTATFDPKTDQFILNSPTLTSFKWWPGGLGHSVNYAIVLAQLYTQNKCHGIHAFIVKLRDQETHKPLPGIKIGEIGSKLGMNSTNNGYLGFDNVRIPRRNMLMKNNKIIPDGTYIKASSSKLTYGTMILMRVHLVKTTAYYLKRATTIATRYSAVRHQSQIEPNEPEVQILNFVTQQHKIFPYISMCVALQFAGELILKIYANITIELHSGDLDHLPELHALSCALKAVSTADATEGVESLRLACGGHGYMSSSNLPQIYANVTAMCTYEGENTVLLLQTARYLIKNEKQSIEPSLPDTFPFEKSVSWIVSILQHTVMRKIKLANQHINERVKRGQSYEAAWNNTSIELVAAALLYGRTFIVETFSKTVKKIKENISQELAVVLHQLLELYAVSTILKSTGDVLSFAGVHGKGIDALHLWLEELLAAIRPNAVGLVDSFDIPDEALSSTLGPYDGNVYERLFAEAQKSPLNSDPVGKVFHTYLKPFMQSNL